MADYTGNLLPAVDELTGSDLNAVYDGDSLSLNLSIPIYRGRVAGEYVYAAGSEPAGATDVVIVGYT